MEVEKDIVKESTDKDQVREIGEDNVSLSSSQSSANVRSDDSIHDRRKNRRRGAIRVSRSASPRDNLDAKIQQDSKSSRSSSLMNSSRGSSERHRGGERR